MYNFNASDILSDLVMFTYKTLLTLLYEILFQLK